ncbi:MAG: GntR family transcriptional regulator [Chloroflexi bacterium]|nr:GntR family transcriptional regulator [Chloroflexota bacterium]
MPGKVAVDIFTIDSTSVIPIYHQIKQNLRELIENEVLPAGQLLPSERDLGEYYGVNRLTVRQAVTELVSEGILRRQRGVGTFVATPKLTQIMGRVTGFSERIREVGRKPSSRVISLEVVPAPTVVARSLKQEPATLVYKLVRLRCADDEPVMLETAYLPQARFPNLKQVDFSEESLYQVLAQKFNCRIVEADETLEPVIMTDYEVEMLEAEPVTPGLLIETVAYNQNGVAVEFGKSVVRGDKSRFYYRIKTKV